MAERFNPSTVWPPFGAFSMAVVAGDGHTVHLKGQVSLDSAGAIVGAGDMRVQVEQVLTNIKAVLHACGGRMSDIISLNHFTTDISRFMETGDIRTQFFSDPYPVTTTLEVSALYDPDLVIEITAMAEIPKDRYRKPQGLRRMHGDDPSR